MMFDIHVTYRKNCQHDLQNASKGNKKHIYNNLELVFEMKNEKSNSLLTKPKFMKYPKHARHKNNLLLNTTSRNQASYIIV